MNNLPEIKRNILLNPGPGTTTDTVKYAQVVPDICPREKEFGKIMKEMGEDLVKIVHGDLNKYTAVLFCGSGTINMDACVNSLVSDGKKMLVVNNGAYSGRAAEVCEYYHMDYVNLKLPITVPADVEKVEEALKENDDVAVVYCCHHETGTGVLNPIREIGAVAHKYGCTMVVDTTSTYAMIPIDMDKDNLDFVMASAQKGLMSMTGLSYVIGNTELIEASKDYTTRSYYTNLYMQYSFIKEKGEMHFTPPVQTIYATRQAINLTTTTAAHAMCYKLTSIYGIAHGHAAALCLPKLWNYMIKHPSNVQDERGQEYVEENFAKLAKIFGCKTLKEAVLRLETMIGGLGLDVPQLASEEELEILAASVNLQRLSNNPIALSEEDLKDIYRTILNEKAKAA